MNFHFRYPNTQLSLKTVMPHFEMRHIVTLRSEAFANERVEILCARGRESVMMRARIVNLNHRAHPRVNAALILVCAN